MKLELSKTIKLEIDGNIVDVKIPKLRDQIELKKLTNDVENGSIEQIEIMLTWLESLGLPKEYSEQMTGDDLSKVIEALTVPKKN